MDKEKKNLYSALSLFLLVVMVLAVYSVFWGALSGDNSPAYRTISVSAREKVVVRPDVARTSFSVVTEGEDTEDITTRNNERVTEAIEYLKQLGVEEKDIRTSEYNLRPVYSQPTYNSYSEFVPRIAQYSLTQTVQVTVRDFSIISDMFDGLIDIGVNKVQNISFEVEDPEVYAEDARLEAFKKAREKAEAMADASGFSLGDVTSVYEYIEDQAPGQYRDMAMGYGGDESSYAAAPTIEPGSNEVWVNVGMSFEIR